MRRMVVLMFALIPAIALAGWQGSENNAGKPRAAGGAHAKAGFTKRVITFSEPEFAAAPAVDGFSTSFIGGQTLPAPLSSTFTVGGSSSTDAHYGVGGPGTQALVDPPGIEGSDAGVITLDFGTPLDGVTFDMAFPCAASGGPISPAVTVELLDRTGALLATETADVGDTGFFFVEGQYSSAASGFEQARLTFSTGCGRFFLDNLAPDYPKIEVPADANWALIALMLGVLAIGAGVGIRRWSR